MPPFAPPCPLVAAARLAGCGTVAPSAGVPPRPTFDAVAAVAAIPAVAIDARRQRDACSVAAAQRF